MKTLYKKIVGATFLVLVCSFFLAFLLSNLYYQTHLKPINDSKVTKIAEEMRDYFAKNTELDLTSYLTHITSLGYEVYQVSENGEETAYGDSFRKTSLPQESIDLVRSGEIYHGIANFPQNILITGFFDNDLRNTIGVPIKTANSTEAIFIRPDPTQQFGELRIYFALLLLLTVLIGFCFIFLSSSFIVKPIKKLTESTKQLISGQFTEINPTSRQDEIGQLTNSFATMATEINKSEKARQEFVANVSHEIQSPLTTIQGYTSILKTNQHSLEENFDYLTIIESEAARLSDLTKQLLALSYLDNENQLVQKKSVDIAAQIRHYIQFTQWNWQEKNIYLSVELIPAFINGNENFLYQIWQNLINNALNYTPEYGEIQIKIEDTTENFIITIFNSGPTIPDSDIDHLFERFYQVDKNRTRQNGTSGLGLAITEKIVHLHNGTISVLNKTHPKGVLFSVQLPKAHL